MNILYKIKQLDKKLSKATSVRDLVRPKQGWVAAIRNALEMSRAQLAARLGLTRDAIQKIEQSEAANTITLKTLQKTADAMGCNVYYVFLPHNHSLVNFVITQAKKISEKVVRNSAKHMVLENQSAINKIHEQINLLTDELLHNKLKNIWKYEI